MPPFTSNSLSNNIIYIVQFAVAPCIEINSLSSDGSEENLWLTQHFHQYGLIGFGRILRSENYDTEICRKYRCVYELIVCPFMFNNL